jgi:hypothetical protein
MLVVPADQEDCPPADEVDLASLIASSCGKTVASVDGEGIRRSLSEDQAAFLPTERCDYPATLSGESTCDFGRPFDAAPLAETRTRDDWCDAAVPADLPAGAREALADAWREVALREHASVAAFSRASLELLALGAPADLVRDTHRAALDEVRHAELAFARVAAVTGTSEGPGPLPMAASVPLRRTLETLAVFTFLEGCVGETLAVVVLAETLTTTTDPESRRVLETLLDDETRHAQLAWRTVAGAIETGGAGVREAVRQAATSLFLAPPTPVASGPWADTLAAFGIPHAEAAVQAAQRGHARVVVPATRALLVTTDRSAHGLAAPA